MTDSLIMYFIATFCALVAIYMLRLIIKQQSLIKHLDTSMQHLLSSGLDSVKESTEIKLRNINDNISSMSQMNEMKLESLRSSIASSIDNIRCDNNLKLEKIREVVEEKLHNTLDTKLNESFNTIVQRLEQLYKGLGEMQNLASGVGDLKQILSNVNVRGVWGEAQLHGIISQILAPGQYQANVKINPESTEFVEFAIKIPSGETKSEYVWLPIDSKFPITDFRNFLDSRGDKKIEEQHLLLLQKNIHKCASEISKKYICMPHSTDFAIMFLPIEALYAQVLKSPGLIEELQRKYKILITGPTTLSAILNSLQMGFKTLAIEQRSAQVWQLLVTIKSEFSKFADILCKTKTKLDQANKVISDAEIKTRSIQKKLESVETLKCDHQAKPLP